MVSLSAYVPSRGDVVWINLDPQAGHEQGGRRPCVVLSPTRYHARTGLALVCPITNRVKGYPFEVALPPGLPVTGIVLADQIKNLDWRVRQAEFFTRLPGDVIDQVMAKLATLLPVEV
jgi:mRNA interferase MazF